MSADLFRLNTNLLALESRSVLNNTNRELGRSQLRLSTALRVNRAEDDAASFSIASKVSARLAGLEQALQNTGDAKSVLDIAEQNLHRIQDLLTEIKQKVIQGANAISGSEERNFVRQQINGISAEINSIIDDTVYNGINILDGSYDATFQVGETVNQTLGVLLDQDITVQDLQIFEVSTRGRLNTGGGATSGSSINVFQEWQSIQAGDTFDIILTQGDGTQIAPITITAAGNKGELTSTTIGDIVAAINGTGLFEAEFNTDEQSIDVREVVAIEGNGLSIQIANFQEFPGTDGAFGNLSFSFDNSSGLLVSNLSSGGTINAGTQLNNLDQFNDLEGQDEIAITLNSRSGTSEQVTFVLPGASATTSNATVGDLRDAINAQSTKFTASVEGGQIVLEEQDLDQINLNASVTFDELDLDAGNASVSNVSFDQSAETAEITGVNAATQIDGSFLGSDFREGDQFNLQLRRNDGSIAANITYTVQGGDTFEDIRQFIVANSGFDAAFEGGNLVIREDGTTSGTQLRLRFQQFNPASVTFNDTTLDVDGDELQLTGITAATELSGSSLGNGFAAGDSFNINLRNDDGTVTQSLTYTFTDSDDTYQDLLNFLDANLAPEFEAEISGGTLIIRDTDGVSGGLLSGVFEDFDKNDATFTNSNSSLGDDFILTSTNQLSPGFNTGTLLNDLNQFTNVQAGDTLDINLQNAIGDDRSFTFTFDGDPAGTSTSTVGDLITAINSQAGISATFDADIGQIVIEDTVNSGNQIQFSFSNAGFTEEPRDPIAVTPNPPLSFSYQNEGMRTTGLGAGGTGTNINDLPGFDNVRGGDTLDITLSTRAGASNTFTFTFAGDEGQDTTTTVADIINFISSQNVGSIQFNAELSGSEILITEENPPAVGGLGTSTSFTEFDIDITPKSFLTFQFSVTDFLRVGEDTGLVLGLGLLDLDSGSEFTQQVASVMIENINNSINRVVGVINNIGNIQTRLSIREESLQNSIMANEAQRSRLQDVDFAKEASRAIQLQILQQFQIAAVTQANLAPSTILNLL